MPSNIFAAPTTMLHKFWHMPNESIPKTLAFTIALCLVCAILVSSSRVLLRPWQEHNRVLERSRNILQVAGLLKPDSDVLMTFRQRIQPVLVDLATGSYSNALASGERGAVPHISAVTFDQRKAAKDPKISQTLAPAMDIAGIKRRANIAPAYLVLAASRVQSIILPIYGQGLWSTIYGFLALRADGNTIQGVSFYEHGETPGLGAEISNPNWQATWLNKRVYDVHGQVAFVVSKGRVEEIGREHIVDGISGATLTTRGVNNIVRYWLGANGFGPFLAKLRTAGANHITTIVPK